MKNTSFLRNLHPASVLAYLSLLLTLSLLYSHPIYTAILLLATILLNQVVDRCRGLKKQRRFIFPLLLLTVILNLAVSRHGTTAVFTLKLPLAGRIDIFLEAMVYGLVMAAKLLTILAAFTALNPVLDFDRVMSLLNRVSSKTVIVISLALRTIPRLAQEMSGIVEVNKTRGFDFYAGSRWERVKKRYLLVKALLLTSLESVWETAESLQVRAFGAGPRTCYRPEVFRPGDFIMIGSSLFCFTLGLASRFSHNCSYAFYPQLGPLIDGTADLVIPFWLILGLSLPVLMEAGYRKWLFIRSKI
ncbi:MAG: energy-coupling factor transporter transmembrane component T [Syntrophomonadaceae bacterium]|nr:energy-coupling factor transporter transmembrane component T [Syntrophomonadaceae bacterium]